MAIETDLSVSPYFDDYNETKDFYKILFQPGVAVQTRELNQLQTILQKQIERFGDNIFKRGTIVDGCNFLFYPSYPYVKILDTQKDGLTANPSSYVGSYIKSPTTGLTGYIVNYEDGFEATAPDMKTLYINYINSGNSGTANAFSATETLTVFKPDYPIYKVNVKNGGTAFKNNDTVVVISALVVNVFTSAFTNSETIYQESTGANLQIIGIDTTTLASSNQVILSVRPQTVHLTNASSNSQWWTVANGQYLRNAASSANSIVEGIIGSGADAFITTDAFGKVVDVVLTSTGSNYTSLPYVTIKSADNTTGLGTLNLEPQNYIANVQIASLSDPVGNGYAFGVTEGVIYQKGYFLRVEPQTVIVEKYSQTPNSIVVGFDSREELIDSNIDTSLLDNALGTENENAPGANRLKLIPELVVSSTDAAKANDQFFILTEWSEGRPFRQNRQTAYNKINDEMARRTKDESGDYVINRFQVTTRSPANTQYEGNTFSVVVDPGAAYISGYRVETQTNYTLDLSKGNDILTTNNQKISLDYGNFIRINEVGGIFQFNTGANVNLYDTAKTFLSNTATARTGNTDPVGTLIGTARMRSMIYSDGVPGTNNAIYKLYLFDIAMNAGKNFRDVKTVHYDGASYDGVADVVLTLDATLNQNIAILEGTQKDRLVFPSGVQSLKSTNNNFYTYRTVYNDVAVANSTGVATKDITALTNEYFPYSTTLSESERRDLYVTPISDSLKSYAAVSGSITCATNSLIVTGSGTAFSSVFQAGDYIYLKHGANTSINRIVKVANNTQMSLSEFAQMDSSSANAYYYYPESVPIFMNDRVPGQTPHSANLDVNAKVLSIQFKYANGSNMTFDAAANVALGVDIERRNVTQSTKQANRDVYVKLRLANNVANTVGPWALGVPDIFRLKSVYIGNSSVDSTYPDAVNDFYIDHNQNANYYDIGYLYLRPSTSLRLTSSDYLLVKFDYGTTSVSNGFSTTASYTAESNAQLVANTDSLALSALTTKYNSFEVPELYTKQGEYYDLLNTIDFRPAVSFSAQPNTTPSNAPTNPPTANATPFSNSDKKFPKPQSVFEASIDQYLGRIESVFIDKTGSVFNIKGNPAPTASELRVASTPAYSMRLNDIYVPPYPNVPRSSSNTYAEILNRYIGNERYSNSRILSRVIEPLNSETELKNDQPIGYSMAAIGNLERRIADLEYYVSLSLLESDLKDRVIPSSIDPALNRFKYGFFVDDFSTGLFSDVNNPAYSARVENDDVIPDIEKFTSHLDAPVVTCDYIDYLIVSQDNATGNVSTACQPSTTVSNNWIVRKELSTKGTVVGKEEVDILNVSMASVSAPVTLYAHFYSGADRIEIYQGNTLILQSNSAVVLTTADKTKMKSNAVPSGWFNGVTFKDFSLQSDPRGQAIRNSYKISWTHNPSNGLNYTVKTTKYSNIWRYALEYPINSNTVTCNTTPNTDPVVYHGLMTVSPHNLKTKGF